MTLRVSSALTLSLALPGLSLACRAAPIPEADRWPAGKWPTIERVIDGTRLRILDGGSGAPVLFIHGLGASTYSWRGLLDSVVASGHRVIAFDNRGFGFSERPDSGYSNSAYVRLVLALLDSLRLDEAVLVGHSMGGAIAAEFAIDHPGRVRGLVLVAPAGLGVAVPWSLRLARLPGIGRLLAGLRGRWTVAHLLRSTYADPSRVTSQDVDQYYAAAAHPRSTVALWGVFRQFRLDALRGRLHRVQVPTLLIWGTADRWIPLAAGEEMALHLPNGALVAFPDAGHNVQEEQPADVANALLSFLRTGLPRPPKDLAGGASDHEIDKST